MEKLIPVEGQKDLYRDISTNAIINTNTQEYENYMIRKKNINLEKKRIENLESDISDLKSSIDEIKNLLRGLANGSKWNRVRKLEQKFWIF